MQTLFSGAQGTEVLGSLGHHISEETHRDTAGGLAVHRRPSPGVLDCCARAVFAGLIGVMAAAFVFKRESFSVLWLGAIPAASIYVLGLREGLLWCTATLLGWLWLFSRPDLFAELGNGGPWPAPFLVRDLAVAYLSLTAIAAAFEFLRARTRRVIFEQCESLLQASRLESIGHLTSGVAHDFNNLLMVIQGNLEIASQDAERAAADIEGLAEARAAT